MIKSADKLGYTYLYMSILCAVISQLLIKWRVATKIGAMFPMPELLTGKIIFLIKILFDPIIFTSCCLTLISGLLWIATLTKLEISYAYPLTMIGFTGVIILSVVLFGESINLYKIIGTLIILLGVFITSKGM